MIHRNPFLCLGALLAAAAPLSAQFGTVVRHKKVSEVSGVFPGGLDPNDQMGRAVVSLGDVDGDGNCDLASGAIGDDDGGTEGINSDTGAVWVHFMSSNGALLRNAKISMTEGGLIADLDTRDQFGRALAPLGDFDHDGVPDLAVGSCRDDDGGVNRGAIYLLMLRSDGSVKQQYKISDTQGGFQGVLKDLDEFGRAIANLGDLDGNGTIDLAVGAIGDDDGGVDMKGAVWILFMNPDGTVLKEQKISDTQGDFLGILGGGDLFGFALACLGDLDGDGVAELAVGCPKDDDGGVRKGAVWILFMKTSGKVKGFKKISDVGGVYGMQPGGEFGSAIAGLGDIDGDGVPDMAVGVILDDGAFHDEGAVFVNFMKADGTVKSKVKINDLSGNFHGNLAEGDWFGAALATIPDLDGNGMPELAVGARFDDDGGLNTGSVWILFLSSVQNVRPTPGFVLDRPTGPAPLEVQFLDRSSAGATSWSWEFGDGAGSSQRDPKHTYVLPGSYTVSLRVVGPGGEATLVREAAVVVDQLASATVRNGSGVNRLAYTSKTLPVLGAVWRSTVDASAHPGASQVWVLGFDAPDSGTVTPGGEILVRTSSHGGVQLFKLMLPSNGAIAHFAVAVPNSPALLGRRAYTQALILGGTLEYCNAIDLVLGF